MSRRNERIDTSDEDNYHSLCITQFSTFDGVQGVAGHSAAKKFAINYMMASIAWLLRQCGPRETYALVQTVADALVKDPNSSQLKGFPKHE